MGFRLKTVGGRGMLGSTLRSEGRTVKQGSYSSDLRSGQRVTWAGMLVNAVLIICKFLAGIFGHSNALIADAVHSSSDFVTDVIVLVGIRIGRKAPDASHHFGHARIETIASALVGGCLTGVAVFIGYQAGIDIYHHTESHPTWLALTAAALSILAKESLYRYTVKVGRRIKSSAIVANAWHHRSDAFSSVAVLIGVAGALINPDWHILDAFAALFVAVFILKVGLEILWGAMREMVDTAPGEAEMARIHACILKVPGVMESHDVKVRSSGGFFLMQVHVVVNRTLTVAQGHRIAKEVEQCLASEFDSVGEVIVHVDPSNDGGEA